MRQGVSSRITYTLLLTPVAMLGMSVPVWITVVKVVVSTTPPFVKVDVTMTVVMIVLS